MQNVSIDKTGELAVNRIEMLFIELASDLIDQTCNLQDRSVVSDLTFTVVVNPAAFDELFVDAGLIRAVILTDVLGISLDVEARALLGHNDQVAVGFINDLFGVFGVTDMQRRLLAAIGNGDTFQMRRYENRLFHNVGCDPRVYLLRQVDGNVDSACHHLIHFIPFSAEVMSRHSDPSLQPAP